MAATPSSMFQSSESYEAYQKDGEWSSDDDLDCSDNPEIKSKDNIESPFDNLESKSTDVSKTRSDNVETESASISINEFNDDEDFSNNPEEFDDDEDFSDNLETETIFKVSDDGDVWETESFNKFGKRNKWRMFEYVIGMNLFSGVGQSFSRPGINPLSKRRFHVLKIGFLVRTLPVTRKGKRVCFSIEGRAIEAAQFALDFSSVNKWNGEKSLRFVKLCYLNAGPRSIEEEQNSEIYYITFAAMDQISGNKTVFQASVYLSGKSNQFYLKAFRQKPERLKLNSFIV